MPLRPAKLWRWLAAALLPVLCLVGWWLSAAAPTPALPARLTISPGKPIPPLSFTDQDGNTLSLADFKGKLVVLDVWATWCAPCRAEFPRLDRLQSALKAQGLAVLPLSVDLGGRKPVDRFYDEVKVKALGVYLDPAGSSAKALGLRGLPTTLIVDRQGFEIARIEGQAAWDGPDMLAMLQQLLG